MNVASSGELEVAFPPHELAATLEQRIEGLFLFGLIPAAGLYAGGHILGQLTVTDEDKQLTAFTVEACWSVG